MTNLNEHDIINMESDYGKKITQAIESSYNLKIQKYSPVPQLSFTSKKALITTDQGIFFLKEKPFYSKGSEELFRSSTFQDYCANHSKNFVEILKSKNNSSFLEFGDKIYFITPYTGGTSFSGKKEELIQMLDTIIQLKHLGKDYLMENVDKKYILPPNKSYEVILPLSLLEPMILTDLDKKVFLDLKKALDILKTEYDSFNDIEYIMSHSDCILFNFQILSDKAILHDFDNAKVLPNIHDLAEFFVSSCLLNYTGNVTNLKLPIFLNTHKNTSDPVIKKIAQNLTTKEKLLIPTCIEIIWIWNLMLSVIKEDYKINDLIPVIENIFQRTLHKELVTIFKN